MPLPFPIIRRLPGRTIAVFAILLAAFCHRLLLPGFHFHRWDSLIYTFPIQSEILTQWLAGRIPEWHAEVLCGTPLLANINAAVFYPLKLVMAPFPLQAGYKLFLFLHMLLALSGMHLFLRNARYGFTASICGASVYAFGGYARGLWDTHNFTSWAWIPWGLTGVLLLAKHPRGKSAGLILLSACMMILGGEIQGFIGWVGVSTLLFLFLPAPRRAWIWYAGAFALALLLTSIQWLPTLLQQGESYRAGGLSAPDALERSFHPQRLLELLIPYAFGTHESWWAPALFGEGATRLKPWTASISIGPILLWIPVFLWRKKPGRLVGWACLTGGIGLLLSLGRFSPLSRLLLNMPVVRGFRYPEKFLLWTSMALAVLTAAAIHRLLVAEDARPFRQRLARLLPALAWCAFLAAYLAGFPPSVGIGSEHRVEIVRLASLTFLPLLSLLLVSPRIHKGLLTAGVVWGLLIPWYHETPLFHIPDPIQHPSELVRAIQSMEPGPEDRYLTDLSAPGFPLPEWVAQLSAKDADEMTGFFALSYNTPANWDLHTASGFSPLESEARHTFRTDYGTGGFSPEASAEAFATYLQKSAVTQLYTGTERWERLTAAGIKGQVHTRWRNAAGRDLLLVRIDNTPAVQVEEPRTMESPKFLNLWRQEPGRFKIDLAPGTAATLHVAESFSPGWSATDGHGKPVSLEKGPEGFIQAHIPAGTRHLRFTFHTPGLRAGAAISGLSLALLLVLTGVHRRRISQ